MSNGWGSVTVASCATNLKDAAVFQPYCGQLFAPDASAVDCQECRFEMESERRPMTADDGDVGRSSMGVAKPRKITGGSLLRRA